MSLKEEWRPEIRIGLSRMIWMVVIFGNLCHASPSPKFNWFGLAGTEAPATPDSLWKAVKAEDLELVKDLVERGVDVNYGNSFVLKVAAEKGLTDIVKYLLEAGADPNGADEDNYHYRGHILREAAKNNHLDIVNILLDAGAVVKTHKYGVGILNGAAENGHLEVVKRLLEAGADPNFSDGYSMLLPAKEGHLDVVEAFIEAGADVHKNGGWVLSNAAEGGHLEVVKALMDAGADTEDYGHAMGKAASEGHLEIVKLFLEKGADPSHFDVLNQAAAYGDVRVVRLLLEAGANITYDDDGGSPLHSAVLGGHPAVVALLVEYGADVNRALKRDSWFDASFGRYTEYGNGWTTMHVAARFGQSMFRELVELGGDINMQEVKGRSPLHIAIHFKNLITTKEILRFCPDMALIDNEGNTVLDLARKVSSANATDPGDHVLLMKTLKGVMLEKVSSSPDNKDTISGLKDEFLAKLENNSTLKNHLKNASLDKWDVTAVIHLLFEERAIKGMAGLIEGHNCQMSQQEQDTIEVGSEYLVTCECVLGEGPRMKFTSLQDEFVCGQAMPVQEQKQEQEQQPEQQKQEQQEQEQQQEQQEQEQQ